MTHRMAYKLCQSSRGAFSVEELEIFSCINPYTILNYISPSSILDLLKFLLHVGKFIRETNYLVI